MIRDVFGMANQIPADPVSGAPMMPRLAGVVSATTKSGSIAINQSPDFPHHEVLGSRGFDFK
jgi:hypothetical protein